MQSKEVRDKIHQNCAKTVRRNFYTSVLMDIAGFDLLTSLDEYVEMERVAPYGFTTPRIPLKWRCHACGNVFTQYLYLYGGSPRCLKCNPLIYNRVDSQEEIDVFNFVASVNGSKYDCFRHSYWNWSLLNNGKLIDIVCLDRDTQKPKLAIEFNGIYWHSVQNKELGYHLMKTKMCEEAGIKLVHIWEDQWINENSNVKAFLEKAMQDEYVIDTSNDMIELDRSQLCKLWVPAEYEIIDELPPTITVHIAKDTKQYAVEDCGKLICKKILV